MRKQISHCSLSSIDWTPKRLSREMQRKELSKLFFNATEWEMDGKGKGQLSGVQHLKNIFNTMVRRMFNADWLPS